MKARETALLKLKRFELDEKARKVGDLEHMIREFENIAIDLDRQIRAEEDRTGVRDPAHFSYSTFAKSAAQRRANLLASITELRDRLEAAQRECDEAKQQLARINIEDTRETPRTSRRRHERNATYALR